MAICCPDCGGRSVVTRTTGARRTRRCVGCGARFATREEVVGRPAARSRFGDWRDDVMSVEAFAELLAELEGDVGAARRGSG